MRVPDARDRDSPHVNRAAICAGAPPVPFSPDFVRVGGNAQQIRRQVRHVSKRRCPALTQYLVAAEVAVRIERLHAFVVWIEAIQERSEIVAIDRVSVPHENVPRRPFIYHITMLARVAVATSSLSGLLGQLATSDGRQPKA